MIFDRGSPKQLPGIGAQRINIGVEVAEDQFGGQPALIAAQQRRDSDLRIRVKGPPDTARVRIEGVHGAVLAAGKYRFPGGRRLRSRSRRIRKSENPFDCKPIDIAAADCRFIAIAKPRIARIAAPAIPNGRFGIRQFALAAGHVALSPPGVVRFRRQVCGQNFLVKARQPRRLLSHNAAGHRIDDLARTQHLQSLAAWRPGVFPVVASGAKVSVKRFGVGQIGVGHGALACSALRNGCGFIHRRGNAAVHGRILRGERRARPGQKCACVKERASADQRDGGIKQNHRIAGQ